MKKQILKPVIMHMISDCYSSPGEGEQVIQILCKKGGQWLLDDISRVY